MGSPQRVLILFAHPALHKSRINRHLADAVRDLDGVTFHDLYEEYPDLLIDANREQALLREHDAIVLQHPFYWYSSPAILKEWQDIVLEYGFAYGENGTALRGKLWLNAITAGGPLDAYRPEGFNRFTIRQLMLPFEQTAHLCGMTFLEPFVVHGAHTLTRTEIAVHAEAYCRAIAALRNGGAPAKNSDDAI
jgi:glutathione-regulated potassium-efflux system ancillary protein KefG